MGTSAGNDYDNGIGWRGCRGRLAATPRREIRERLAVSVANPEGAITIQSWYRSLLSDFAHFCQFNSHGLPECGGYRNTSKVWIDGA
jgi:hypothetical protein